MRCSLGIAFLPLLVSPIGSSCNYDASDALPVVVMVSIDGFRADYLDPINTPNLYALAQDGVKAEYLETVFPSKTFPTHYTIVTGLYPEHHGIVGNSMYDPDLQQSFSIGNREAVRSSVWWQGEPIWVTLEKQGRTTAPYLWVGSEAEIAGYRPTWWIPYADSIPHSARIDTVMRALSRNPRPALVTLYFSHVDTQGHRFGPDSPEVKQAVSSVDRSIGELIGELKASDLYESVNLVILSDHGMAAISDSTVLDLADYLDDPRDLLYVVSLGAVPMFNVKEPKLADSIVATLNQMEHVTWYKKGELPNHLHFNDHPRIPDIVGLPEVGWRVLIDHEPDPDYRGGTHGYDPTDPNMHTLFLAHGPAFRVGLEVEPFSSIHIYELLCEILGVTPAANDGDLDVVRPLLIGHTELPPS